MKKERELIIFGDSKYAEMLANYFQKDSIYEVVAYCVDRDYRTRNNINGLKVYDFKDIESLFSSDYYIFSAIGYNSLRIHKSLYERVKKLHFKVASYVSSKAIVDDSVKIGDNCLILPGTILEPNVVIEENTFLNSGVVVSHDAKVKAHTVMASGSLVGGYTNIGECSLLGFNSTVVELLNVGRETLLAAGSVLLQNSEDYTMYAGTPAKAIRKHKESGIVLV